MNKLLQNKRNLGKLVLLSRKICGFPVYMSLFGLDFRIILKLILKIQNCYSYQCQVYYFSLYRSHLTY